MQECQLQVHLTVWEAMFFSINLKIGAHLKRTEKKERVKNLLLVYSNGISFASNSIQLMVVFLFFACM